MKGSPLTIVVIAAVVIIGGSIVTYLLIENSPQESGFDPKPPEDGRTIKKRVPRPNVYEDTEPLPIPTAPLPDEGGASTGSDGADTKVPSQDPKPRAPQQPTAGGELVKPIAVPPLPD